MLPRSEPSAGLRVLALLACVLSLWGESAWATPPVLYSQSAYESPTHAQPDSLLLIPGYGFHADDQIVYEALRDSTRPLRAPESVPLRSDATEGIAAIASEVGLPYSVTVHMPSQIRGDQAYGLWVRTAGGEWSRGIRVNDARPLWFAPSTLFTHETPAGLSRELIIVGRNLGAAQGASLQVRLLGPRSLTLAASAHANSSTQRTGYVAMASLPKTLASGRYRVELSRDGVSWVPVSGQWLTVRPDPVSKARYAVDDARFGGCQPDDGRDDAPCILRAISFAARHGGGTVFFPAGTWNLVDATQAGVAPSQGIVLPHGVSLVGLASGPSRIERQASWQVRSPAFSLLGHNSVTGLTFHDAQVDRPHDSTHPTPAFLQLGETSPLASAPGASVDDIIITANIFDRVVTAIADAGLPLHRLSITHNEVAAYENGLSLTGNLFNTHQRFGIDDSIISQNRFEPAGYLDVEDRTAAVAAQIGAGFRLLFSDNIADGASQKYLQPPDVVRGWRAGFFWSLQDNNEFVLISGNRVSCSGDAIGDGEAIALDNSVANTFGFTSLRTVVSASADSVVVPGPLVGRQHGIEVPSNYYVGHWLHLADGPGIGQARHVVSYRQDAARGLVTLRVSPRWDVIPSAGHTRVVIGREFWQVYILDNLIDHRTPRCLNSNRSRRAGGAIALWAQNADSVIAGNQQFGSDGIWVHQNYQAAEHPCPDCAAQSFEQAFLVIASNRVEGSYRDAQSCGNSGINLDVSAAPWGDSPPPTISYGLSIEGNVLIDANGPGSGAIGMPLAWYAGPDPHRWPLMESALIQKNQISIHLPVECAGELDTAGIGFPSDALVWHSIQYANSCTGTRMGTSHRPATAVSVCTARPSDSCECVTP